MDIHAANAQGTGPPHDEGAVWLEAQRNDVFNVGPGIPPYFVQRMVPKQELLIVRDLDYHGTLEDILKPLRE